MELINDNSSIYYDDSSNNYKEFYIEYLIAMNEKIKQMERIKIIDIEEKKPNDEKEKRKRRKKRRNKRRKKKKK